MLRSTWGPVNDVRTERRQTYRVAGDQAEETVAVFVGASSDGRGRIEAELSDLSIKGAQVRIVNESKVPAPVGGELHLWLVDRITRVEAAVTARVVHRREEVGKRVIGLEFTDRHASERLLQAPLARLFNRRAAFRATPDPADGPVAVTVLAPREARLPLEVGALVDVSTGGLCVDVALAFERGMAAADLVEVVLRLPGTEVPVTTHGRIRHRSLRSDGRVRYGIEFARKEEPGFHRSYESIVQYVLRRQREMSSEWIAEGK
jgi:c-di-GMP-binding flagellar brake protein YcgR